MNNNLKLILITAATAGIVSALVALIIGGLVGNQSVTFGAIGITRFPNSGIATRGVYIGTTMPTSVTDGTFTATGVNTLSGATTITGTAAVSQTSSSTLKIGYAASGLLHGCLVLGDSGGATSTPVYITATGATLSATTTKPTICK